jgi:hypothetical protein
MMYRCVYMSRVPLTLFCHAQTPAPPSSESESESESEAEAVVSCAQGDWVVLPHITLIVAAFFAGR